VSATKPFRFFHALAVAGALAATACAGAAAEETDNIGLGHLTIRSLSPGHLLRPNASISMMPAGRGDLELAVTVDWGNVWNYREDVFLVDAEWLLLSVRGAVAVGDDMELGIIAPLSFRSGGCLDYLIEDFHSLVGLDNGERENFPRNDVHVHVVDEDGSGFHMHSGHTGVCDVPLYASYRITKGGRLCPALAVQAGLTLPASDKSELEGTGQPVFGCSLLAVKRLGYSRSVLHACVSGSYCETDSIAGIELREWEATAMLGWEYQLGARFSLICQYTASSPVAVAFYEFSKPAHELNVGFKRVFAGGTALEASLTENVFSFNNSTDVGLHLGISRWF